MCETGGYWRIEPTRPGQDYCLGVCKICGQEKKFSNIVGLRDTRAGYIPNSLKTGKIRKPRGRKPRNKIKEVA